MKSGENKKMLETKNCDLLLKLQLHYALMGVIDKSYSERFIFTRVVYLEKNPNYKKEEDKKC
jgi:hypothetical protein